MSKVIILRGVPGSGKSTWVEDYISHTNEHVCIVSRDAVREFLFGPVDNHGKDEKRVTELFYADYRDLLNRATLKDFTIIVDNTNCDWQRVVEVANEAKHFDIPVEIFTLDTSLEEALRRNAARDRVVPEHVIRTMWAELQESLENTL